MHMGQNFWVHCSGLEPIYLLPGDFLLHYLNVDCVWRIIEKVMTKVRIRVIVFNMDDAIMRSGIAG